MRKKIGMIGIGIILLMALGCSATKTQNLNSEQMNLSGQMEVHFVDVGQGQAQVILTPAGRVMVVDGGNNDDEQRMVDYLTNLGVTEIDVLIGTHPDADHIGGIDAVIDAFDVKSFYMPPISVTTDTFKSVLASSKAKGLVVQSAKAGVTLDIDSSCEIEMLAPIQMSKDSNEMSVVVKTACGKASFLLTGDIEGEAEQLLLDSHENLDVDVLLVPHHGSDGTSSTKFLQAVTPKIGIIQSGKDNSYGHPHEETLKRLEQSGTEIYRNDELGNIVVSTDIQTGVYTVNQKTAGKIASADDQSLSSDISNESDHKVEDATSNSDMKTEDVSAATSQLYINAKISNSSPKQNENETVTVTVIDEKKQPISNANVTLTLFFASKETVYTTKTNGNGIAEFSFQIGRAKIGFEVIGKIQVQNGNLTERTQIMFTPSDE